MGSLSAHGSGPTFAHKNGPTECAVLGDEEAGRRQGGRVGLAPTINPFVRSTDHPSVPTCSSIGRSDERRSRMAEGHRSWRCEASLRAAHRNVRLWADREHRWLVAEMEGGPAQAESHHLQPTVVSLSKRIARANSFQDMHRAVGIGAKYTLGNESIRPKPRVKHHEPSPLRSRHPPTSLVGQFR